MTAVRRSTRARPSDDVLLDAAREVFATHGYRASSMHAVATAADCTKPTLYAHFGDKEQLYRRLLEREAQVLRQWLFTAYEANAGLELTEQVRADTLAFFDYAAAEPQGFRLLLGEDPTRSSAPVLDDLLAAVDAQVGDRIRAFLRGLPVAVPVDVGALATILVAVPVSSARHALDTGGDLQAAAQLAAGFSAAAVAGLTAPLRDLAR